MASDRARIVEWLREQAILYGRPALAIADAIEQGAPWRGGYHPRGKRLVDVYPCGHPRTADNTIRVGADNGVRCRTCRLKIHRASAARMKGDGL